MKRFLTLGAIVMALVMAVLALAITTANRAVERNVEQAVRYNFAAAGLLSRIQVQAERMRRYEKEMFIYASVADKRAKYVKDYDDAYAKLLDLLNQAMASQHKGFTHEERQAITKWSDAAAFYGSEFRKVTAAAESAAAAGNAGDLTLRLNNDIGPGKDRFRELLEGASKLREAKEKSSLDINQQIDSDFARLNAIVIGSTLALALAGFFVFARRRPQAPGAVRPSNFVRSGQFRPSRI